MQHASTRCLVCNAPSHLRLLIHNGSQLVIWAIACGDHLDALLEGVAVSFEDPACQVRIRPLPERTPDR